MKLKIGIVTSASFYIPYWAVQQRAGAPTSGRASPLYWSAFAALAVLLP